MHNGVSRRDMLSMASAAGGLLITGGFAQRMGPKCVRGSSRSRPSSAPSSRRQSLSFSLRTAMAAT